MTSELTLQEVFALNAALCRMLSEENLTKLRHLLVQHNLTFDDIGFSSDDYTEDLFVPYYNKKTKEIVIRMPDADGPTVW